MRVQFSLRTYAIFILLLAIILFANFKPTLWDFGKDSYIVRGWPFWAEIEYPSTPYTGFSWKAIAGNVLNATAIIALCLIFLSAHWRKNSRSGIACLLLLGFFAMNFVRYTARSTFGPFNDPATSGSTVGWPFPFHQWIDIGDGLVSNLDGRNMLWDYLIFAGVFGTSVFLVPWWINRRSKAPAT